MESKNKIEAAITSPASHVPDFVSIQTVAQSLPFDLLRWENFEKLCYRLAGKDTDIESHSLYGRTGQAQQGIDIFSRKRNSRYNSWQAKCYQKYTKSDLKKACSTFLSGGWADRTDTFFIAVQCPVDDVHLQNEIEGQAKIFHDRGITLKVLGGHDLCTTLRSHPDIVLEFFGRECAKQFFGDTVSKDILLRLDGNEVQKVRTQLLRVYQASFEHVDKIPVNTPTPFSNHHYTPISLLERFSTPDVLLKESVVNHLSKKQENKLITSIPELHRAEASLQIKHEESYQSEQFRRTSILNWLPESDQLVVIGHAGTGKSTVLRCLALDLLSRQQRFAEVAKKWGCHLPLFISFAKWVRLTEANVEAIGIKELLRATWQPQLTADLVTLIDKAIDESRVVLFVDGLDEWANEQAARTTLQAMLTIVSAHNIPVVASARPSGLSKIGGIPDSWTTGLLAPLSPLQQKEIATIWFAQNARLNKNHLYNEESVVWQINRFFKELDKGRGLATLAQTPLLLLGLIALAMRQLTLPINKVQALRQLTDVLLEIHPSSRATAAGDVVPRFSSAASIDVRREALAALAFEIRSEGGDAGYPIQSARKCIKTFLSDPEGFCYSSREASNVADEILAVNSETMGLLVEKGFEEVGFVHASLEEYLASVHIHGWPIERILEFVRENASNFRWRSVFSNLIARSTRRSEAEQIVNVIDEPENDVIGALQRRLLLADVVFSGAGINKPTAIRLADRSLEIITSTGWATERSFHLAAAIEGIYNPIFNETISTNICRWGIKSVEYLHEFYRVLSGWSRSETLLNILRHGMQDGNVLNARSAAQTLATVYKGDAEIEKWLMSLLRGNADLRVVSITLEALTIGWQDNPILIDLLNSALSAHDKILQLSAIWCKVQLALHVDTDLKTLLDFASWSNGIDYEHRGLVARCLIHGWIDNQDVIDICLDTLNKVVHHDDGIDRDIAEQYLVSCDANNPAICAWILQELESEHPFIGQLRRDWGWILKFAEVNKEIQEKLILIVTSEKVKYFEFQVMPIFNAIEDPRIKQHLIDKVKGSQEGLSSFWALKSLLEGWASNDSDVCRLIQKVIGWPDDRKKHFVHLYPKMLDREACIQELLRITNDNEDIRTDFLVNAFYQLDITDDKAIIDTLITKILSTTETRFSGSDELIALCPDESRVKEHALSRLAERNPPLTLLASVYHDDPTMQMKIAEQVCSLNETMRQQIIDAASCEFDRNDTAKQILAKYDHEVDGSLKVQGAIKNFQALYSTDIDHQEVINRLLSDVNAVGYDHDERRAAAFAGLVTYGATEQFVPLEWSNKPLDISLGSHFRESPALLRLIAEHWEEIDKSFGQKFISRLGHSYSEPHFWTIIAPYVSASSFLRKKFIDHCINSKTCLEVQELQALAKALPKSDLLLQHCLLSITNLKNQNAPTLFEYQSYFEAAYILRDQFGGNEKLLGQLQQILKDSDFRHGIAAMAIYDPYNSTLDEIAKQILSESDTSENYVISIILAISRFEGKQLETLVKRMINRTNHSLWYCQDRINYAIKSRIENDAEFVSLIRVWLASNPTESEISSFSRYLAFTGKLDDETQQLCQHLLNERNTTLVIPAHGYDAISDLVRPVSHSLLDVLVGSVY